MRLFANCRKLPVRAFRNLATCIVSKFDVVPFVLVPNFLIWREIGEVQIENDATKACGGSSYGSTWEKVNSFLNAKDEKEKGRKGSKRNRNGRRQAGTSCVQLSNGWWRFFFLRPQRVARARLRRCEAVFSPWSSVLNSQSSNRLLWLWHYNW